MTDVNDFTDYTEPCSCGHRQHNDGPGGCPGTVRQLDTDALPTPVYEHPDEPFEWPANWPPYAECPQIERPCRCVKSQPADPEPPEEW